MKEKETQDAAREDKRSARPVVEATVVRANKVLRAEARKLESRKLVAEELQREKESTEQSDATDTDMPDDTDGLDPEQEYRDWELREMRRIKRDRDQREARRKEAEETLRRRNMTEEERRAEDEKLKKNQPTEKKKLKFLQKYYHKGAFYMDDASVRDKMDVRRRDASEATLEDKFNKEMLPAVMQVKNFGRAGRTKYTHLAAEDTSTKDALWNHRDSIRDKFRQQLSGTRELDSAGSSKKKQRTE
ncbi:hypothetical protein P43SY_006899 [Pythium insidiosum]|uniref:Micro-fibrillar-associated protein 1 C-terminal domain-containing protein n=1 Tax=Pythium insidiosum TaxID=114742 RepID=A0AAD5LI86_PYTIN|nr:hypothetical protein P43SY_006899 [Pythium insidiosum]